MLVSGGHNLLLVVRGVGDYQLLGSTIDDAVGKQPPPPPPGTMRLDELSVEKAH